MRTSFFNINLFSKYKSKIEEKNYKGIITGATVFITVTIVDFFMELIFRRENMSMVFIFYDLILAAFLVLLKAFYKRSKIIVGLVSMMWYAIGYAFACHMQILFPDGSAAVVFGAVTVGLSVSVLMEPVQLLVGQIAGTLAMGLTVHFTMGMTKQTVSQIVIVMLLALILGLIFTYVRVENLAFDSEITYFSNGEDDGFVNEYADFAWSGRNKYGILSGELSTKRRVFTFVFSVSKEVITSIRDYNILGLKNGMKWEEARNIIIGKALDPGSRMRLSRFLDLNVMKQVVKAGKKRFSVIAGLSLSFSEKIWVDMECVVRPHPITGELLASVVVEDISEERILMGVLNKIVEQNYDFVMCVEGFRKGTIYFKVRPGEEIRGVYGDEYSVEISRYIKDLVAETDVDRAYELMNEKTVETVLSKQKVHEFLLSEKDEDGKTRKKLFQYSYMDPSHNFISVIKQDVTELIIKEDEAKARLAKALDEKETAMNARSEFMTRMSHEMRTPMNAILGLSDLMNDEINNPAVMRDYIGKLQYSGKFLLQLINDVLDMSKMEQEKFQINLVPYRFGDFWEAIDMLIGPMCIAKGVDFEWKSSIDSDTYVMTDPLRVTQIFVNLLSNAVKYTPSGGHVSFECKSREYGNNMYRGTFIVKDDGVGMSPEFIEHMFEPFAQESKDVNANLNGTGLGLAIVKGIVEAMDGKITCKSEPGVGTTFKVVLDFEYSEACQIEPIKIRDEDLEGKRILVVEDNDINREIAVAILEKKKIKTEIAVNGQEAVEQFAKHSPGYYDLILMDIRMPVMSGLTATKRIRAMDRDDAAAIPIVAMTANAFSKDVQASIDAGINEHLSKPIDPKLLFRTIIKYTS